MVSVGFEVITGRILRRGTSVFFSFADDIIGRTSSSEELREIEKEINLRFKVELSMLLPPKWAGKDFQKRSEGGFSISSHTSCSKDELPNKRFTIASLSELSLEVKSEDDKSKKEALSWNGKLLYAANVNPYLKYVTSFLASALHYDPRGVINIVQAALRFYTVNQVWIPFYPLNPTFLVVHSDSSHTRLRLRAHVGTIGQLQETPEPEELHNPVFIHSERIAQLYDSTFAAEAKGLVVSIGEIVRHLRKIKTIYSQLTIVLYCDNMALVKAIHARKETHPFSSDMIDFIREKLDEFNITLKWVSTKANLADCLTKPTKPPKELVHISELSTQLHDDSYVH